MKFDRDYARVSHDDIVWCVLIEYYALTPDQPPKLGVVYRGFDESGNKWIGGELIEKYYIGDVVPVPSIELEDPLVRAQLMWRLEQAQAEENA